jgi:pullulanase
MGLHDLETMQEVENAVHGVNSNAIIYGEGWTMGNTIDGSAQANQTQIGKIKPLEGAIGGIAVFNDAIRDGLKGSVFMTESKGYISGAGAGTFPGVLFGIRGGSGTGAGWKVNNSMVVNYMSAHDNNTLWDKLAISNGDDSIEDRLAMNRLGATILMCSKGAVFFQAGEEMLRSKPKGDGTFDENSYKSSDEINNIRWDVLKEGNIEYGMVEYYKGLIQMRKEFSIFKTNNTAVSGKTITDGGGRATVSIDNHMGGKALMVMNPTGEEMTYTIDASWNMICNGSVAGAESLGVVSGEITIPAYSAVVLVNDWVINNK